MMTLTFLKIKKMNKLYSVYKYSDLKEETVKRLFKYNEEHSDSYVYINSIEKNDSYGIDISLTLAIYVSDSEDNYDFFGDYKPKDEYLSEVYNDLDMFPLNEDWLKAQTELFKKLYVDLKFQKELVSSLIYETNKLLKETDKNYKIRL